MKDTMSERIKPYGGSSSNRLVNLLNRANASDFVHGVDLEFGEPEQVIGANSNTRVAVRPKSPGFKTQYVNYRRLSINALNALPPGELAEVLVEHWPFVTHDELPKINEALGLGLLPHEVVNEEFADTGQTKLTLRVSDKSLAWLPSEVDFSIRRNLIPLTTVWSVTVLEGLNPPEKS